MNSSSLENGENLEVTYFGDYITKGNKKYIIYKEYEEGNPNNYSFCVIRVEKNLVSLTKNKKYQTKIILEKGLRHYSPYYTDYGLITMNVYTHDIKDELKDFGGSLNVSYSINFNTELLNVIDVTVNVEKINK